jgi:predicted RNA binding protein YcfA (HicA-like mRNA interferase family)
MAKRTQHVGKSKGKSKTKMKVYNSREARKIARKNGWILVRTNGDHTYLKHPEHTKTLVISEGLNRMVWERCVKEFNIDLNV